jgi:hypothetical protein
MKTKTIEEIKTMLGLNVIIRNAKDNPTLLASKVKKGDVGTVSSWHKNLACGTIYLKHLRRNVQVSIENIFI